MVWTLKKGVEREPGQYGEGGGGAPRLHRVLSTGQTKHRRKGSRAFFYPPRVLFKVDPA